MAAYAYSAINALGTESAGQLTAPDVNAARELLRQKGLRPVSQYLAVCRLSRGTEATVCARSRRISANNP